MSSVKNSYLRTLRVGTIYSDPITLMPFQVVEVLVKGLFNKQSVKYNGPETPIEIEVPKAYLKKGLIKKTIVLVDRALDIAFENSPFVLDAGTVYSRLENGLLFKLKCKDSCKDPDTIQLELDREVACKRQEIIKKFQDRQGELTEEIISIPAVKRKISTR